MGCWAEWAVLMSYELGLGLGLGRLWPVGAEERQCPVGVGVEAVINALLADR